MIRFSTEHIQQLGQNSKNVPTIPPPKTDGSVYSEFMAILESKLLLRRHPVTGRVEVADKDGQCVRWNTLPRDMNQVLETVFLSVESEASDELEFWVPGSKEKQTLIGLGFPEGQIVTKDTLRKRLISARIP